MTPENETKALELVSALAEKTGQAVEVLWPEAVRYVVVDGVASLVALAVMLAAVLFAAKKAWGPARKAEEDGCEAPLRVVIGVGVGFVLFLVLSIAPSEVTKVFAPTGHLVHELVRGAR